jgi:15-cis-phytoene synthase
MTSAHPALQQSYAHCRDIARTRARNFYYSFVLLPDDRKNAMCAVYAFNRFCDDLSDEPGAMRMGLERWRDELIRALAGSPPPGNPIWPAFADTAERFGIPHRYFHEMIDGVASDLDWHAPETFADLYRYCYQVASVVGLTVIHIFGNSSPEALHLAEKCGVAFQLTNILRDIREDLERGRVYLPAEDLARFGVDLGGAEAAAGGAPGTAFRELMRFEAARARAYYDESRPLIGLVEPECRASMWALIEIYRRLLERIERSGYDVLARRMRLSTFEKALIVLRARMNRIP